VERRGKAACFDFFSSIKGEKGSVKKKKDVLSLVVTLSGFPKWERLVLFLVTFFNLTE